MSKPVALITGVGRRAGIGAGIARKLAEDGWDLALVYWPAYDRRMPWGVPPDDVAQLEKELTANGGRVRLIEKDLAHSAAAAQIFHTVAHELGRTTALILSHCEWADAGVLDTSVESFDRHFAVNARASWQLIQEFAAQAMPAGGRVVALTSDAVEGNLAYGASKAALDQIIFAAARELGHLKITANLINPGPVDTGWMDELIRYELLKRQPSGRLGSPRDIAELVSFLLSPEGAWMNGQLLHCDGGFSTPR